MAFEYFNSVGGISIGIPPVPVIDGNGSVVSNVLTSGNVVANVIRGTSFVYSNGQPLTSSAAGANSQLQFNSNGVFGASSSLTFNVNNTTLTANNISITGLTNLGAVGNITIEGGTAGYVLSTDGLGTLSWVNQSGGGGNGNPGGGNAAVQFNDEENFGGNSYFTFNKSTGVLTANNIVGVNSLTGTLTTASQPNITSVGSLSNLTMADGGNITNANWVIADYISGNGSQLTYITGANVVGAVNSAGTAAVAATAGTVTSAAQPNITSVGLLNSISISGNANLGNISNVHISGGTNGYVLQTDGTGNLSWTAQTGGGGGNGVPGGSNTQVQFNDAGDFSGSANLTFDKTTNTLSATLFTGTITTSAQPNITSVGTLNSLNVSNVSNLYIPGGSAGYVLSTDGYGNLSWNAGGSGGNGTPGGTNMQVQFNNAGAFGASAAFTFDSGPNLLSVPSIKSNSSANFTGATNVNLGNVANLHISGGQNGYVLQTDGSGTLSWVEGGGGGGGSPGGANTQVQFNNDETFGGSAYLTYNDYTRTLQVGGNLIANSTQIGAGVYKFCTSRVYFATTSSSAARQVLFSIPVSEISGVEYHIIGTEPAGPSRQSVKISALTYNQSVQFTEYAGLYINGGVGNFEVDYNAGDIVTPASIQLLVSPNTSNAITYRMLITEFAG
jgi:hypothetical protein